MLGREQRNNHVNIDLLLAVCQIKKNIKLGEGTETGLEEYISAQIIAIQNKQQGKGGRVCTI